MFMFLKSLDWRFAVCAFVCIFWDSSTEAFAFDTLVFFLFHEIFGERKREKYRESHSILGRASTSTHPRAQID